MASSHFGLNLLSLLSGSKIDWCLQEEFLSVSSETREKASTQLTSLPESNGLKKSKLEVLDCTVVHSHDNESKGRVQILAAAVRFEPES